jgi:hypothetical protein
LACATPARLAAGSLPNPGHPSSDHTAEQRYAVLWNYLAACIAQRLDAQTDAAALGAAAAKFHSDARAAGRGTTWLSHLAAPVETTSTLTQSTAADPLDAQAMDGVLANAARIAKPSVFDTEIAAARAALTDTPSKPYEAALVTLGQLAGAVPSDGDHGNAAAPDATWIFGTTIWVTWEAKSDAKPDGELGAGDVRPAGGHLRFVAAQRGEAAPGDSPGLLMTPQKRVRPSAHAVAEDHLYLVRRVEVVDLFDRLVRAWLTARTRDPATVSIIDPGGHFRRRRRASLTMASATAHPAATTGGRRRLTCRPPPAAPPYRVARR